MKYCTLSKTLNKTMGEKLYDTIQNIPNDIKMKENKYCKKSE